MAADTKEKTRPQRFYEEEESAFEFEELEEEEEEPAANTENVFCPTGEGGGIDPTCSPGGAKAGSGFAQAAASIEQQYGVVNTGGNDTASRYKQSDGTYSPQRTKLHKEIQDGYFKGKKPVGKDEKPTFYLMGGGPAAGKSTILNSGKAGIPDRAVMAAADEVKKQLPEFKASIKTEFKNGAGYVHEESSEVAKGVMRRAVKGRYDTVLDGTGDTNLESVKRKSSAARAQGLKVVAHYVTIDTEEAVRRSELRRKKTGRGVVPTVTRDKHVKVSQIVPEAIKAGLFDEFALWDNNGDSPKKIASAVGKKLTVHDTKAWQSFLDKGKGGSKAKVPAAVPAAAQQAVKRLKRPGMHITSKSQAQFAAGDLWANMSEARKAYKSRKEFQDAVADAWERDNAN